MGASGGPGCDQGRRRLGERPAVEDQVAAGPAVIETHPSGLWPGGWRDPAAAFALAPALLRDDDEPTFYSASARVFAGISQGLPIP